MENKIAFIVDLIYDSTRPNIVGYVGDNVALDIKVTSGGRVLNLNESNVIYKIIKPDLTEFESSALIKDNLIHIELDDACDIAGNYELYFQVHNLDEQLTSQAIKFRLNNNPFGNNAKGFVLMDSEGFLLKDKDLYQLKVRR